MLQTDIVVSPPYVYLIQVRQSLTKEIQIAGQNCYYKANGTNKLYLTKVILTHTNVFSHCCLVSFFNVFYVNIH